MNSDDRHLNTMRFLIGEFRARRVGLNKFIVDQWALLDLLEGPSDQWVSNFRSIVNKLDTILAVASSEGREELSASEVGEVETILSMLEQHLNSN